MTGAINGGILDAIMAGRGVAGLTERIMCVELAGWFVAMGWKAFRQSS